MNPKYKSIVREEAQRLFRAPTNTTRLHDILLEKFIEENPELIDGSKRLKQFQMKTGIFGNLPLEIMQDLRIWARDILQDLM